MILVTANNYHQTKNCYFLLKTFLTDLLKGMLRSHTVNNFKKIKCWWFPTAKENFASDLLYEKNKTRVQYLQSVPHLPCTFFLCTSVISFPGKAALAGFGVGTGVLMSQLISLVAISYNQMCVMACFTFSMYVLFFTELTWS